jgi:DNA-binding transcriptional MerR regulator
VPDVNRPIFSIGAVSRMIELPPATIRTWETRYALVVPQRSPGGQRLYSREQVEQLRFLKTTIADGARPGEAHRLLAERLPAGEPAAPLRRLLEEGGVEVVDGAELVAFGCAADDAGDVARRVERRGHRVLALVAVRPPGA